MTVVKNENFTDDIGTLKRKKNSNSILSSSMTSLDRVSHDQGLIIARMSRGYLCQMIEQRIEKSFDHYQVLFC